MRLSLPLSLLCLATPALSDGPEIAALLAAADGADVVILGEVHDNPTHHEIQAALLQNVDQSATVFEMLDAEEAARITPDLAADLSALETALDWSNSGWPDFAFYGPVMAAAANAPIFGAEISREAAQTAFGAGAASVFSGDAARFGLDQPLPDDQQSAREAEQLAAHCDALPVEILPGFVEAQRLRDAALAEAILTAFETHGGPVVAIMGNGHARADWGVPTLLAFAAPDMSVVTVGQVEGESTGDAPFDLITTAAPVVRPDPCAAFR